MEVKKEVVDKVVHKLLKQPEAEQTAEKKEEDLVREFLRSKMEIDFSLTLNK